MVSGKVLWSYSSLPQLLMDPVHLPSNINTHSLSQIKTNKKTTARNKSPPNCKSNRRERRKEKKEKERKKKKAERKKGTEVCPLYIWRTHPIDLFPSSKSTSWGFHHLLAVQALWGAFHSQSRTHAILTGITPVPQGLFNPFEGDVHNLGTVRKALPSFHRLSSATVEIKPPAHESPRHTCKSYSNHHGADILSLM